jgi:hypothetical protein
MTYRRIAALLNKPRNELNTPIQVKELRKLRLIVLERNPSENESQTLIYEVRTLRSQSLQSALAGTEDSLSESQNLTTDNILVPDLIENLTRNENAIRIVVIQVLPILLRLNITISDKLRTRRRILGYSVGRKEKRKNPKVIRRRQRYDPHTRHSK